MQAWVEATLNQRELSIPILSRPLTPSWSVKRNHCVWLHMVARGMISVSWKLKYCPLRKSSLMMCGVWIPWTISGGRMAMLPSLSGLLLGSLKESGTWLLDIQTQNLCLCVEHLWGSRRNPRFPSNCKMCTCVRLACCRPKGIMPRKTVTVYAKYSTNAHKDFFHGVMTMLCHSLMSSPCINQTKVLWWIVSSLCFLWVDFIYWYLRLHADSIFILFDIHYAFFNDLCFGSCSL